jgi:hypothetical protein
MPIGEYFKNHGDEVMSSMKNTYKDPKKAESVFYATANKTGMKPGKKANAMKGAAKVLGGK